MKRTGSKPRTICPCCNRPMDEGDVPVRSLVDANLTRMERTIIAALVNAYPRFVAMDALIDACYGDDPGGGPLYASESVAAVICRLRKKLHKYGWMIPNSKAGYRNKGIYELARLQ